MSIQGDMQTGWHCHIPWVGLLDVNLCCEWHYAVYWKCSSFFLNEKGQWIFGIWNTADSLGQKAADVSSVKNDSWLRLSVHFCRIPLNEIKHCGAKEQVTFNSLLLSLHVSRQWWLNSDINYSWDPLLMRVSLFPLLGAAAGCQIFCSPVLSLKSLRLKTSLLVHWAISVALCSWM